MAVPSQFSPERTMSPGDGNVKQESEGEVIGQRLMQNFDPNNPPMLSNYDRLNHYFKLPSKNLLRQEKNEYMKHINTLRHAAKYMIKKSKQEAKEIARQTVKK